MEEVIELIRIESVVDGWGVFRSMHKNLFSHSQRDEINRRHSDSNLFPTPSNDPEIKSYFYEKYLFGFLSLAQFNVAFTNEEVKEFIEKLDFKVYSIKVSKGRKSKFQVIYHPDDIIEKTDISYLFL